MLQDQDLILQGGILDGAEAFLGQVKALVDSKADKEEVANLGQVPLPSTACSHLASISAGSTIMQSQGLPCNAAFDTADL